MAEDNFVLLGSQVGSLLDSIADEIESDSAPGNNEVREVLEYLSKMEGEPEDEYSPRRVAEKVYNDFHCYDFPTAHLARKALEWLGPKKEDKPKQTKRKPGRPRKTTK